MKYFVFFNFIILIKNNDFKFIHFYIKNFLDSKTINESCGFDFDIILYSDKNKIYDYILAEKIISIQKKYKIIFKQEYDIDEYYLRICIFNNNDMIYNFCYLYDGNYDNSFLDRINRMEVIMSEKKEDLIVKTVSEKLALFDLELKNYYYTINEEFNNSYEMSFEHKNNGSLILVKNIKVDEFGNVVSIGFNRGLVF